MVNLKILIAIGLMIPSAPFTLVKGAPAGIAGHVSPHMPPSYEATSENTSGRGMSMVIMNLDSKEIEASPEEIWITLSYTDDESGETKVVSRISTDDEEAVSVEGFAPLADDGVIEFDPICDVVLMFSKGATSMADLRLAGTYTIHIPEGAFLDAGVPMEQTEIVYTYFIGSKADMSYILTPESGSEFETFGPLQKFCIEFPKANTLDYLTRGGGTLTDPDGRKVPQYNLKGQSSSYANLVNNKLYYCYGVKDWEWKYGQYKFEIKPSEICIDSPLGNFPGLTATYVVDDNTGVAMVGISPAESYDVYGLDGRMIMQGASPERMQTLPEGLYVVNGKKCNVSKM